MATEAGTSLSKALESVEMLLGKIGSMARDIRKEYSSNLTTIVDLNRATINEVSDTITVCNSFFHVFKPILAGLPSSKADVQMIFKSEFEDHLFDEAISKLTKNPNKGQNNFEIATYCLEEVRGHLQRLMNLAVNESQSEHYSMIVVGKDYEPFGPEIMKAINAQVEQAPQDEPPAQEPEAK